MDEQQTATAIPAFIAVPTHKSDGTKFDRNDKIIMIKDGQEKEIKYKKLADELHDGWQIKTESKRS
jgi:hypothetical protein